MVDVKALKEKFAGYPNILADIDMMVERNDQSGLERYERGYKSDATQTISFFAEEDGSFHTLSLEELDEFVKGVAIMKERIGRGELP